MADVTLPEGDYSDTLSDVVALLEEGRRAAARSKHQCTDDSNVSADRPSDRSSGQGGQERGGYGQAHLQRLPAALTKQFGRSFAAANPELMRLFYQSYPPGEISEFVIRRSWSEIAK